MEVLVFNVCGIYRICFYINSICINIGNIWREKFTNVFLVELWFIIISVLVKVDRGW